MGKVAPGELSTCLFGSGPPSWHELGVWIVHTILSPVRLTISYMVFSNLTALHMKCNYC